MGGGGFALRFSILTPLTLKQPQCNSTQVDTGKGSVGLSPNLNPTSWLSNFAC